MGWWVEAWRGWLGGGCRERISFASGLAVRASASVDALRF